MLSLSSSLGVSPRQIDQEAGQPRHVGLSPTLRDRSDVVASPGHDALPPFLIGGHLDTTFTFQYGCPIGNHQYVCKLHDNLRTWETGDK